MEKEPILIGIVLILLGVFLLIITKFHSVGIIYGVIIIALGIALIILNKEEKKIEQRKDINTKKNN